MKNEIILIVESFGCDHNREINMYLLSKNKSIEDVMKILKCKHNSYFDIVYLGNKDYLLTSEISEEYVQTRYDYLLDYYNKNKCNYEGFNDCFEKYEVECCSFYGGAYDFFNMIDMSYKITNKFSKDEIKKEVFYNTMYISKQDMYGKHRFWNESESEYNSTSSYEGTNISLRGRLSKKYINNNNADNVIESELINNYKNEINWILESYINDNIYNKDTFMEFNKLQNIEIPLGIVWSNEVEDILKLVSDYKNYKLKEYYSKIERHMNNSNNKTDILEMSDIW